MATAWLNALAHPDKVRGISAGTEPTDAVDVNVVAVMKERGIDVSSCRPQALTPDVEQSADRFVVIAPPLPGALVRSPGEDEEWGVADPAGEPIARVREIRDEIERRVRRLLVENHWMPFGASTPPGAEG